MKFSTFKIYRYISKALALSAITSLLLLNSCGFKVSSFGSNLFSKSSYIISGVVSPLVGLIAEDKSYPNLLIAEAYAGVCATPAYAKLYHVENDGTINDNNPISSQLLSSDARYSFNLNQLLIASSGPNVEYIVKVEGCNGDIYKRPVTSIDANQEINAKTTVVAEVLNSNTLLGKTLNQVSKSDVAVLINSISGSTTASALASLTTDPVPASKFNQIFGSSPVVILSARPEVTLNYPTSAINELAVSTFAATAVQVDHGYSIAYSWKLDGVVKSSASSWNYIPGANDSGTHQIEVYVGSNDGSGNVDTSKLYYTNTTSIKVNNNILPTPPNITVNASTPSPVNTNSISVDLSTGASMANCASFSHLAITDSATIPGISQFIIDCSSNGVQTESVTFSTGDGTKTLYLWAIDNEGIISSAKSVSLVVDSLPPVVTLSFSPTQISGGKNQTITLGASDAGTGVNNFDLYFSSNGGTSYSLLSHLANTTTSYNWPVPSIDTTNAKLKLVATDFTSQATIAYSSTFTIDSTAPTAPVITLTSPIISNSTTIALSVTCSADYDKILYSSINSAPGLTDTNWETCASTKNFIVSTGDGVKNIYAFTKDNVGNISTASNVTMTLDTTLPVLALTSLNSGGAFKGGSAQNITWSATDTNFGSTPISISYSTNGSTYTSIANNISNSGSYSWTLPTLDSATITLKISATDAATNVKTVNSANFIIDSTAPAVAITDPTGPLRGGTAITLNYSGSDANTVTSLKLYYAADGTTYGSATTLTIGSTSYSWSIPTDNVTTAKLKLVATDTVGNVGTAISNAFSIDSAAPTTPVMARTSPASSNSTTVAISTTCIADYDKILYSQTSATPLLTDAAWETCASTKNFTVSAGDGLKTIYAFTKDVVGNISASSNVTMTLDTTPPAAPVSNLASATISSSTTASFTITDCLDRPYILVSESMIAPTVGDSNWQTCSTGAAAISYVMIGPVLEQIHTLYVYAKDAVGNISASTSASMVYDITNPTLSLSTTLGSLYKGGDAVVLNFSASDTNGVSSLRLEYAADGSTYSLVTNLAPSATTYTWTVPGDNTASAKIRLVAKDNAMAFNSSTAVSTIFTIDSTPPTAPTMTLSSAFYTTSTAVNLSVSSPCSSDTSHLLIKEGAAPLSNDAGWAACAGLTGAQAYTLGNTTNGIHAIKIYAKDPAGNITTGSNVNVNYDTTLPVLSLTSSFTNIAGGSSNTLTWTLTEANASNAQSFLIEMYNGSAWTSITTLALTNGPHSGTSFSKTFSFPSYNTAAAKIRISYTDLAGNFNSVTSGNFTIDSTAPISNSISINSNATSTGNKNILVSFNATDALSNVSSFCLKYNSTTTPLVADSCWTTLQTIGVAPASTINVSNFPFQLGSIQGDYDVRIWLQDSLGNISTLTNSGAGTINSDLYTITYTPDPAPIITNFIGSSTDSPASPLSSSDTTITLGNDVNIKWNITDNAPIPAGAISLYYTTNDSTYTLISNGLSNNANNSCTVTGAFSGCYRWSSASPSSAYYRIKLIVTDSGGSTIYEVSNPINTGSVNFLSGNTSLGIGGMATNSILIGYGESGYNDIADPLAIAVSKTGFIFYRYYGRGLVYISPQDGILRDLVLSTGTMSGDGGNVFNATFKSIGKITKDYNDNILVWDFDRIRKISTSTTPWTITTLFGGGADASDGASGLSANITASNNDMLTPTPNGRIYFYKNLEIWYYDPTDLKVKKYMTLSGTGTDDMLSFRATLDNVVCPGSNQLISFNNINSSITKIIRRTSSSTSALCGSTATTYPYYNTNFNLSTGVAEAPHPPQSQWSSIKFTGLDGNIYELEQGRARLKKYNIGTNAFTTVIGTGTVGRCVDGTAATSCNAVVMSAFVTELGKIYFIDLGVLRTIDSSGNVQTVAGQPRNFGIGSNPISARYSQINFFDVNGNDIFVKNELENQITKFSLAGGNLIHIGGNTIRNTPVNNTDAKLTPLPSCSWSMPCSFIVDGPNNRLYHYGNSPGGISYIDLNTGKWVIQSTSGLQDSATRVSYLGLNSDGLVAYLPASYGVTGNKVTLRVINESTLASTIIYGQNTILTTLSSTLCNGVAGTDPSCTLAHTQDNSVQTRYKFDSTTGNWLIGVRGTTTISQIPYLGGTINVFKTLTNNYVAFDFYKSGVDDYIFYCGTNGNLYKKNLTTNIETLLTLPISSMKCTSGNIHYHQGRNSLIFAYTQNGLYGMAEFMNP